MKIYENMGVIKTDLPFIKLVLSVTNVEIVCKWSGDDRWHLFFSSAHWLPQPMKCNGTMTKVSTQTWPVLETSGQVIIELPNCQSNNLGSRKEAGGSPWVQHLGLLGQSWSNICWHFPDNERIKGYDLFQSVADRDCYCEHGFSYLIGFMT